MLLMQAGSGNAKPRVHDSRTGKQLNFKNINKSIFSFNSSREEENPLNIVNTFFQMIQSRFWLVTKG